MNTRDSSNCGKGTLFLRKVPTSDFFKEPFIVKKEKELERKRAQSMTKRPGTKITPRTEVEKPKTTTTPASPNKEQPSIVKKSNQPPVKKPAPPAEKETQPPVTSKMTIDSSHKKSTIKRPSIPVPKEIASRTNELVKTIFTAPGKITVNLYDNGTIDNDTVSVFLNNKLMVSKKRLTATPIELSFDINEDDPELELVMVAENLGEIPPNTSLMVVKAEGKQYEVRITSTEQKNAVVRFRLSENP